MSDIYLSELQRGDLAANNRWRADRQLIDQLGSPFRHVAPEIDERWYEQYLASRAHTVRLAICRADGSLVGASYLLDIDWVSRNAEFAIWIGEAAAQGQGIGTAATRLTLQHAFEDLNLERIHLLVLAENERAIKLYRSVGFREEGVQRRAVFKRTEYRDLLMMAVLRAEFLASRDEPAG